MNQVGRLLPRPFCFQEEKQPCNSDPVTEVIRLLDQDLLKKLAHGCKHGLLKQALYLKSEPEYCVFIIRYIVDVMRTYGKDAYM